MLYCEAFLTTYRTFISPEELIKKLQYRYPCPAPALAPPRAPQSLLGSGEGPACPLGPRAGSCVATVGSSDELLSPALPCPSLGPQAGLLWASFLTCKRTEGRHVRCPEHGVAVVVPWGV